MLTTTSGAALRSPEQVAALFVRPTLDASVAAQVSTVVPLSSGSLRIPIVASDPTAAWTAEGAELNVSDAVLDELVIAPRKLAGLSIISNELANDSSPAAAEAVGQGLARDCARKLDAAFFGALSAPAPSGLGALSGVSPVSAGASWSSLDPFVAAQAAAETVGAKITAWVANPATALSLATIKTQTGSVVPLLGADPTSPTSRTVAGVPLFVSAAVANGVVWGIDGTRSIIALRQDATVEADSSPFFSSDRTAIRAVLRASFGWPHPASVVKITTTS